MGGFCPRGILSRGILSGGFCPGVCPGGFCPRTVVNTFRMWNGPPKFCIELETDWLLILDDARRKSPG